LLESLWFRGKHNFWVNYCNMYKKQLKLPLQQAMEANTIEWHWASHIFYTISSQILVRMSPLCTNHDLAPKRGSIARLGQLKAAMTSSGIEPMTFFPVTYHLNHLHHCMPHCNMYMKNNKCDMWFYLCGEKCNLSLFDNRAHAH
jgi:hypothetical protein